MLDHALELVVQKHNLVDLVIEESLDGGLRDLLGFGVLQRLENADVLLANRRPPSKEVAALAAHRVDLDRTIRVVGQETLGHPEQGGVEGSAQALVGGDHDDEDLAGA
jgi:hypothetical protein